MFVDHGFEELILYIQFLNDKPVIFIEPNRYVELKFPKEV